MSRKVTRLTLDHLAEHRLARARPACSGSSTPSAGSASVREEAAAEKEAWVSHVLREWGSCGRVVLVDDRPVGFAIYAPPIYLPGAGAFPTAPVSPDAVLLSTVWVHPEHTGGGLGRMLIQGMARDLVRRGGISAVEAFGDTRGPGDEPQQLRGAGGLPGQRGLQDASAARHHPADADGSPHRLDLADRGRGGTGAPGGRRTAEWQACAGRGPARLVERLSARARLLAR